MGYRCPVCADPQADDVHLANHLAFTALVRGGDHERWLGEQVPDWGGMDDETLADVVTEHADQTEYPQVFEDTTGEAPESTSRDGAGGSRDSGPASGEVGPGHQHFPDEAAEYEAFGDVAAGLSDADSERRAREILEEARELTRRRRSDGDAANSDDSDGNTDADTDADTDSVNGEDSDTETHSDTDTDS